MVLSKLKMQEIKDLIEEMNLSFGMDVSKYLGVRTQPAEEGEEEAGAEEGAEATGEESEQKDTVEAGGE